MLRLAGLAEEDTTQDADDDDIDLSKVVFYEMPKDDTVTLTCEDVDFSKEEIFFGLITNQDGEYILTVEASSELGELAQLPISAYMDNIFREMITFQGMNGGITQKQCSLGHMLGRNHYVKIKKNAKGLEIKKLILSIKNK